VRWFLDNGADPHAAARASDITPFSFAVKHATWSVIDLLYRHSGYADHGQLAWHASQRKDAVCLRVFQWLLEEGASVDDVLHEDRPLFRHWAVLYHAGTPLYNAVSNNNSTLVKLLLMHGADPRKGGAGVGSAIDLASLMVVGGDPEMMAVLRTHTPAVKA